MSYSFQDVTYLETPSPHVVIDNFFPDVAAQKCLEEAIALEPHYEDATTVNNFFSTDGTVPDYDDCEICKSDRQSRKDMVRFNSVVNLEEHYKNRRHESTLLQSLNAVLNNREFNTLMKSMPHLFPLADMVDHVETNISQYGRCNFYGWHTDDSGGKLLRMLSIVLHLNTEPQDYAGGELILTGDTILDRKAYKPVHNRAIIFQSNQTVHAVQATHHEGGFADSGFSFNIWLGFQYNDPYAFKYRQTIRG